MAASRSASPSTGPTIRSEPLERLYQVPFGDPPVVVAEQGDTTSVEQLDAASV